MCLPKNRKRTFFFKTKAISKKKKSMQKQLIDDEFGALSSFTFLVSLEPCLPLHSLSVQEIS
jgi:hypothetical protein